MDLEALSWASLVRKTVRIVQNPSLECYMSTRYFFTNYFLNFGSVNYDLVVTGTENLAPFRRHSAAKRGSV